MRRWILFLFIFLCPYVFADEIKEKEANLGFETLYYDANLRFNYYDRFVAPSNPGLKNMQKLPLTGGDGMTYPTLGLTKAAFNFWWEVFDESTLFVGLRPDALLPQEGDDVTPRHDFDSRVGMSYRPSPVIYLLDTYHVSLDYGHDLKLSYGVWEGIEIKKWETMNTFGLLVMFPEKFSAFRVFWQAAGPFSNDETQISKKNTADFYIYRGNRERGEAWTTYNKTGDSGPSVKNPYLGAALSLGFDLTKEADLSAMIGQEQNKGNPDGNVQDLYGQLVYSQKMYFAGLLLQTIVDARYDHERFTQNLVNQPDRVQASGSLVNCLYVTAAHSLLLAGHVGSSDRMVLDGVVNNSLNYRGYQFDFGYTYKKNSVSLGFLASEEHRYYIDHSKRTGAFLDGDTPVNTHRRFGVELTYLLSGKRNK
jgi:hypothetical protein